MFTDALKLKKEFSRCIELIEWVDHVLKVALEKWPLWVRFRLHPQTKIRFYLQFQ